VTTAEMLALIAEVDRRGSFRGEGFSSMYKYCVEKLRMSEDVACKRILTARAARRLPAILPAIADGRLTISTVALLSTHLKTKHAEALLMDAVDKTRAEVELLIAARFPKEDVPTTLIPVAAAAAIPAVAPAQSDVPNSASPPQSAPEIVMNAEALSAPGRITPPPPSQDPPPPASPAPQRRVAPLSPGRFELRLTISQALHDKLRRAQELLSHCIPDGDIPQLLERALDELITKQERLKFAATDKPRAVRGSASNSRHIPAAVKREIRLRDGGRCTFVSDDGHRCDERKFLEYDHELPSARGGQTTVANLRLRCRAHNQLAAERTFGAGFMEEKRRRGGASQTSGLTP